MSLPQPIDLLTGLRKFFGKALFFFGLLLVIAPIVQWAFIVSGIALIVFKHWIIGILAIVIGLVGRKLREDSGL